MWVFQGNGRTVPKTYDLLRELELDKVHLARYSPRPGTVSARRLVDDVPEDEKRRRFQMIEQLQKEIGEKKNKRWLGKPWRFWWKSSKRALARPHAAKQTGLFDDPRDLKGQLVRVQIQHTGPWSLSGVAVDRPKVERATAVADMPASIP